MWKKEEFSVLSVETGVCAKRSKLSDSHKLSGRLCSPKASETNAGVAVGLKVSPSLSETMSPESADICVPATDWQML